MKKYAQQWDRSRLILLGAVGGGFYLTLKIIMLPNGVKYAVPLLLVYFGGVVALSQVGERLDLSGIISANISGKHLEMTRKQDGWNWNSEKESISHRNFYRLKQALFNHGSSYVDEHGTLQIQLSENIDRCKMSASIGTHPGEDLNPGTEMTGSETIETLSMIHMMRELAVQKGCDLTFLQDTKATYHASYKSEGYYGNGKHVQQAFGRFLTLTLTDLIAKKELFIREKYVPYSWLPFTDLDLDQFRFDKKVFHVSDD
jgi:hypothetical protein